MVRQPPVLLSRVIRAIAALGDPKGSSLPEIISQVRVALDYGMKPDTVDRKPSVRKISMQVKRAVRHALDKKLLLHRTGRYRLAARSRLMPVDSLEFAAVYRKRHMNTEKSAALSNAKKNRNYEIAADACRRRKSKRRKCRRRRRRSSSCRRKKRRCSKKKSSKSPCSCQSSKSSRSKSCSGSRTSSKRANSRCSSKCKHSDTPMPESTTSLQEQQDPPNDADGQSISAPQKHRRASYKTNHTPFRPPNKTPSEDPPNVKDELMDSQIRKHSHGSQDQPRQHQYQPQDQHQPRQHHYQYQHHHQRQHQQLLQDDDKSEIDSLDEDLDLPSSYYN